MTTSARNPAWKMEIGKTSVLSPMNWYDPDERLESEVKDGENSSIFGADDESDEWAGGNGGCK